MNKLINWLILGLALACGAPQDVQTDYESGGTNDGDIGQTEQELAVNLHTYGLSTADSHMTCNDTNSGQSCLLPRVKDYVWCMVDSGFSSTEQADIRAGFALANQLMPNRFTFAEVSGIAHCSDLNPAPGITVKKGTCAGGSTSGVVESFLCPTLQPVFALTESVPGTWSSFGGPATFGSIITVDTADINAQPASNNSPPFTAAQEQSCLRQWGIAHWAYSAFAGGGASDSTTSTDPFSLKISGRQLRLQPNQTTPSGICATGSSSNGTLNFKHNTLSAHETCEMRSYSNGTLTAFNFTGTVCP